MEPVRPLVDAYVLDWLMHQPLKREWFFEERSGTCRLMGRFAERLSETASTWGQGVAPIAERVARGLWATTRHGKRSLGPATRLTEQHRRDAKGRPPLSVQRPQSPPRLCRRCGDPIPRGDTHCAACWTKTGSERMLAVAAKGRLLAQTPEAQARRAAARKRNIEAERAWKPLEQPEWLTEGTYLEKIRPRLVGLSAASLASALGVSKPYAVDIRAGRSRPHPRHWRILAELVGVSPPTSIRS
jgi:hypothetical protein